MLSGTYCHWYWYHTEPLPHHPIITGSDRQAHDTVEMSSEAEREKKKRTIVVEARRSTATERTNQARPYLH